LATPSTSTDKSDRAFRTISEASEVVGVPQHVLRFWETRFPQLQPLKRGGNRRYYRPADMALLETIRAMLHDQGLTIRGAKLVLAGETENAPRTTTRAPKSDKGYMRNAAVPESEHNFGAATVPGIGNLHSRIDLATLRSIRDRLRYALAA
jgi:DNA-binding transcriptional MerR regulator